MRPGPALTAVAVTAVVALGVGVATAAGPSHERTDGSGSAGAVRPSATSAPLTDVSVVCPAVPAATSTTSSVVTAASPSGPGTVTLSRLGAGPGVRPVAAAPAGSTLLKYVTSKTVGGPLVVHATGTAAQGLTAQALVRTVTGRGRAISSVPCTQATAETWLVGGSAVSGRRDVLYLSNPETAPAVADVTVYGARGAVQPPPAQGLTVPAGRQVALALDSLVPGEARPVVSVRTRSGRVAAAMVDIAANGDAPRGRDWVPPSTLPSLHPVVAGIPGDADGRRVLTLLVPGDSDASVRVRFATPEGTLSPPEVDSLLVPSGQTYDVDLGKLGLAGAFSVLVDSDQPVVAGVRTERGGNGSLVDFSYAGSTPTMVGTGVVLPLAARDPGTASELQLTAPSETDVVVRVTPRDPAGHPLASTQVTVTGGRMVVVPVGLSKRGYTSVLVESSGQAPLVVGWVLTVRGTRGPLFTGGPLLQTPLSTLLPPVVPDPSAGLPGHDPAAR